MYVIYTRIFTGYHITNLWRWKRILSVRSTYMMEYPLDMLFNLIFFIFFPNKKKEEKKMIINLEKSQKHVRFLYHSPNIYILYYTITANKRLFLLLVFSFYYILLELKMKKKKIKEYYWYWLLLLLLLLPCSYMLLS